MNSQRTDIVSNRQARKWSAGELVGRLLWDIIGAPVLASIPRQLWSLRRLLLRSFGARIGREVHIHPTVKIAIPWNISIGDYSAIGDGAIIYALGRIDIRERVTISQYAHICAGSHDHSSPQMKLTKPPICVGSDAWICADAFIGPGVTVGEGAVVGARAVAMRDVPPRAIVVGNPSSIVGERVFRDEQDVR